MLAKKNRMSSWIGMFLLLAGCLVGCTPAGPRALLGGKKLLDSGDYTGAVAELHTAVNLLPDNASAWNYLGVAYQKAQQPDNAASAYTRALTLNRDLVEAHWNLGMLYLEQGKNDQALSEFTAYTLRRNNSPEGWLKLGATQLRLGQIVAAERSFGAVLTLDKNNAEAINGQGLARIERNRPREAVQFFAAAMQANPAYPSAALNLAVTEHQYLHDTRTALPYYHAYLALTPRRENWDEVNALATSLEQGMTVAPAAQAVVNPEVNRPVPEPPPVQTTPPNPAPAQVTAPPVVVETHRPPPAPLAVRPVPTVKTQPVPRPNPPVVVSHAAVPTPAPAAPPPPVVVHPQPVVQTQHVVATTPVKPLNPANPQVEAPPKSSPTEATAQPGFWDRIKPAKWFTPDPLDKKYENTGLTPQAPTDDSASAGATLPSAGSEPAQHESKAPPTFPHYGYQAPARPHEGDHRAASGSFTRARVYEQGGQWMDAMQAYRSAAEFDPGWYEAQYNFGVLSYRLGNHRQAMEAYEMALAIQPDSVDARYNFALALKAGGYVPDAVNELKKLLNQHPDEVRARLALGNLYAQKLHETNAAREQYLKVLEMEPGNPSAGEIRNWLSAHAN